MIKKYILIIAFICCGFGMQAQIRLTGEIADKNGKSIPGVSVDFGNGLIRVQSDNDGKFAFTYPDTLKNRPICFQSFGYKRKTMTLNKGQQTVRAVLLDSVYSLGTVLVSASRHGRFSDYSAQTYQMSAFDIVTNPAAMADIIGNMRVLPGVQTADNDGRLIIHGGSSDESQIYINDLIVSNPYLSPAKNVGVRSRFTPDLFSGTVLQSGGFNAEFGQALSGIVNLSTKERDQMTAKTDISVILPFMSGVTQIDQRSTYAYRASLDYSNQFLYDKITSGMYKSKKPYQSVNSDIFLTKEFSTDTKLTAQFNGNYGTGLYIYRNVDNVEIETGVKQAYVYGQMNFYHVFGNRLSLSAATNVIVDRFSREETQYKIASQNIWNHSKITLQYKSGKIVNRTGVESVFNPYRETYSLDVDYNRKVRNSLAAVYTDTKLFLTKNLTASAGIRCEYSMYLEKFNLAPRLYLAYRLNTENIFSVAAGDYFQLPSMDYLKVSDNIDFTSVRKATASYSYVRKDSKFQIDAYYKKYNDAVVYFQGQFIDNSGYGHGLGADVFWKSSFRTLEYWLTYSYNNTVKKYDDFPEAVAPPYAAPHSFNATLKYWIAPLKSLASLGYNITSGLPYYSDELPRTASGTTPFHSRLDISWSYLPKPWIIIHLGCRNVSGKKNIYGYEYSKITPGVRKEITAAYPRLFIAGIFITFSRSKTLNQLQSL
ncbi:MAG: TonB-dependent receptor [Prevotellaceae bacterium]|jgi:hypothetical protein|nr:TonB-dependent receptor [Prevotellaceae bacterium]